ncbi:hypothetical protein TRFO_26328 [Tritrichomonas foetus]|uniref:Uncharacterized protein n=1 Tax=Tritrichomonas foetus TaxID=1144522 RepID=A0A1J4K4P5_9EUKA|nr:hypothetical protein TRFO_26328 [Tritrichomonas foetus]|eukprot:OHT05824.1 hypothetical protein TRFO_26328 [Tritrichomonas foetus]
MTKSNMKSQLFILKTIEAESKLKLNPKQTVSEHEETIRKHYLSDDVAILCFPGGSFADKTYHEFKERNNNTDKFMYYVSFVSKSKIDLNDKQEHHVRLSTCNELLGDCYDPKYPQLICCFLKYCRKLLSFN